jgi:hypothetical protein
MKIYFVVFFIICTGCNSARDDVRKESFYDSAHSDAKSTISQIDLPFIGKKQFETRPAISGTGTPQRYVEINRNGDVYFSFEQVNQADGEITTENYYAGKYAKCVKSVFKKLDNETRHYEITEDAIFEVDENCSRLSNEDCCNSDDYDGQKSCPCQSSLH